MSPQIEPISREPLFAKQQPSDERIALCRSEAKIGTSLLRLVTLCALPKEEVFPMLSIEQKSFFVSRHLFSQRPDLMLSGRTLFGVAPPTTGGELTRGLKKERIARCLREYEEEAMRLGISLKVDAQNRILTPPEKSAVAVDRHSQRMQLLQQLADKHGLAALLHEKPFAHIDDLQKRCSWSLVTEKGRHLLDPKADPLLFLILLSAIVHALWEHAALFCASLDSLEEESVPLLSLGEGLHEFLHHPKKGMLPSSLSEGDPRALVAWGGDHLVMRLPLHLAFFFTTFHAIVADSLHLILDEIADAVGDRAPSQEKLFALALPVLQKRLKSAEPIFAAREKRSLAAYSALLDRKSMRAFEGIFSEEALKKQSAHWMERYAQVSLLEIGLLIDLFRTQILPAALFDQRSRAEALASIEALLFELPALQREGLSALIALISAATEAVDALVKIVQQIGDFGWEAKAKALHELGMPAMEKARGCIDCLESMVDRKLWPFPTYRELLFG